MSLDSVILPSLPEDAQAKPLNSLPRLSALAGVETQLTVVAGQAKSTVGELLALKAGMVMQLDTPLNAPFDICLNGQVLARGELVAMGDQFGVRIVQVAPQSNQE